MSSSRRKLAPLHTVNSSSASPKTAHQVWLPSYVRRPWRKEQTSEHLSLSQQSIPLLDGLSANVKLSGHFSRTVPLRQGVGQGKVLSTSQYKTYIDGVLVRLKEANIGAFIGPFFAGAPGCADDLLLISYNQSDLQVQMAISQGYADEELYNIHPKKTQATGYDSKDDPTWTMGDTSIRLSEEVTHLGITRVKDCRSPTSFIEDRIKAARGAMYSLMGAGLHGVNGLPPIVSRAIYRTFVIPVLLYGLEVLVLTQAQINTLEDFHRNNLKMFQSLPTRVSNDMTFLLLGMEPVEALIDRRIAALLGKIASQKDSLLYSIILRQLAVKDLKSKSWVMYAMQRLHRYELPSLHQLLASPPSREAWKRTVKQAVTSHWTAKLLRGCSGMSSLRFIHLDPCTVLSPHPVWRAQADCPRAVRRSFIKARVLTGVYTLQANRHRFNQFNVEATCPLCGLEPEDRRHFLRACPETSEPRRVLDNKLTRLFPWYDKLNTDQKLHFTLDASRFTRLDQGLIPMVEDLTNCFIYKLHSHRHYKLNQQNLNLRQ